MYTVYIYTNTLSLNDAFTGHVCNCALLDCSLKLVKLLLPGWGYLCPVFDASGTFYKEMGK